jgi:hypothetical protein
MKIILLVLILTSQSFVLSAQEIKIVKRNEKLKPNSMTFLNYGGAFGRDIRDSGDLMFFLNLSLNHIREDNIYSLKVLLGSDFNLFSGSSLFVNEISAMYGWVNKGKFGYGALSAGLGYVSVTRRNGFGIFEYVYGTSPQRQSSTVGLSLEAQGFGNLFVVGIGVNAFLNLNTELIYGGIGIQLQIGDLMNEYHN